jgi:rare lipoprotein A
MLRRSNQGGDLMKLFYRMLAAAWIGLTVTADAGVEGMASYYKSGRLTANGERFNPHGLTAAHRKLPFGTRVKVTNVRTGKSVVVRINDRGPFISGRVIDLSLGAAKVIGLTHSGVARVSYTVIK